MYYVCTYVIPRVYNKEESIELPYTLSKLIASSVSGYYSKFILMIEVMILTTQQCHELLIVGNT